MTIQEILEAHQPRLLNFACLCGAIFNPPYEQDRPALAHRAHVAEVLDKHMQEREAAEVERLAKVIEDEGEGYARTAVTLTGTDNTRYHAYAVARQGISHQLKFRADQIRKATTNGR